MPITITFEETSKYNINIVQSLFEFVFDYSDVYSLTSSTFEGGGFIGSDSVIYSGTGTDLYVDDFTTDGTINSIDFDFGTETISMSNMDLDVNEVLDAFESSYLDDYYAVSLYLLDQTWNMTLSNNDDIAKSGQIDGSDSPDFNLRGDDFIRAMGGNDDLFTGDGADVVYGGRGSDRLHGGSGADKLYGGSGADELIGARGADRLYGNGGADALSGGGGRDKLYGGGGADELNGNKGKDILFGKNGADVLLGGGGGDKLNAGRGNDHLRRRDRDHRLC